MLLTVNGIKAVHARVIFSLAGPWSAQVSLDTETPPSGVVAIGAPGLALVGTVVRSGTFRGLTQVEIVGGAAKMSATVAANPYVSPTLGIVVRDLLGDVGEALSSAVDASILTGVLSSWMRMQGTARAALETVLDTFGGGWRVLDDGTIWIGVDSFPTATFSYQTIDTDEAKQRATLAAEDASLRPGVTLDGKPVAAVVYTFADTAMRIRVEYGKADPLEAAIVARVHREMRRLDYYALYPSRVLAQSSDLRTVDLACDSAIVREHQAVPLRLGIPGTSVKLATGAAGARVHLGFEGGDPSLPYAALFEGGGLKEIVITADTKVTISAPSVVLADGNRAVACVGDIVQIITPTTIVPAAGTLIAPSGGGPVTGTVVVQPITAVGQIVQAGGRVTAP